jgi:hypothetical protein
MSRPFEDLEPRALCSATLFDGLSPYESAYAATASQTVTRSEPSVTRTLAEAFAGELARLHSSLEGLYDSAFVDTESAATSDFRQSLLEQLAVAGDTLTHYQDSAADEGYLSTTSGRPSASLFCRRCLA